MSEGSQRRLAAIVAIDVAGYSRLMGADERGTLDRLKGHRAVVDPIVINHGGRIVGTAGDGLLLEFPSVVAAVECAVEIQAVMADRNTDIPADQQMLFRIGVNLGDVLVDGDDIYGDGVNIAARLEALAEPGGICISRAARDQVRDRVEVALVDMGEVEVKNIARPIRVFTVANGQTEPVTKRAITPADPNKMAFKLPEKPSIAVLPFDNLSGDPAQDYIGDGLTENIIALLSTTSDLFVIARNSSFTYKGKAVRVQDVSQQLGVRYVLEGSVQVAGSMLRVTAQLIDAIDGHHMWAERFTRELQDLFALQDDITERILIALHVKLTYGDAARRAWNVFGEDLETYRLYCQARPQLQTWSAAGNREAERLSRLAIERQPDNATLIGLLGWVIWQRLSVGISRDPSGDLATTKAHAERALAIDEDAPSSHGLLAAVSLFGKDFDNAIVHADRALALAPNLGPVVAVAGWGKACAGQPREAVQILKHAMRLEPYYFAWIPVEIGVAYLMLEQYDEARTIFESLLNSPTDAMNVHPRCQLGLAAISVFEGDLNGGQRYLHSFLEDQPTTTAAMVTGWYFSVKDQEFVKRFVEALRQAGLPEGGPDAESKETTSFEVD
jgi:adenylate cyclase